MGPVRERIRRLTWRLGLFFLWLVILRSVSLLLVEFADEIFEADGLPVEEPILICFDRQQTMLLGGFFGTRIVALPA